MLVSMHILNVSSYLQYIRLFSEHKMQAPCLETLHSWCFYCQLILVATERSIAPQHWKTSSDAVLGKKEKEKEK